MDPSSCRVIYIDERFPSERWIGREGLATTNDREQQATNVAEFQNLPFDLQANVNAFLSVFNQVFICRSGISFSSKLSDIHDKVRGECTPILACIDIGSLKKHEIVGRNKPLRRSDTSESLPTAFSPSTLKRELTFTAEHDESYGLPLLSRIASDLQVDEGIKLIIPVAVVQSRQKDLTMKESTQGQPVRENSHIQKSGAQDDSDTIEPSLMLQCLDAGALDVVKSPLDKAGIMGLTVHAYRIYKVAKAQQDHYMTKARRGRKASWVGIDEEKPYAYLRESMVRKLLKGICEPETYIEDYQHRDLIVKEDRMAVVQKAVGRWDFCAQDFSDDELVYAGTFMLEHALSVEEVSKYRQNRAELLRFMQGCRVAYNNFVLYHNFKHAVDVLQSTFYFLLKIGLLPPYAAAGVDASESAAEKSPVAKLLGPFEALTLIISAIGHDVGHPGVNNMFLVKLNAPLAQLYNDTSVLEAFHCAAYSQILRRHWPAVFHDKAIRKLMISTILATDMGCHADYMHQMGQLQEKIHQSKTTDSWTPKEIDTNRILACGLLIKCADISNVARPWAVAEKWTYKLQEEFAHQGDMEKNIGMETTLFGGPPEIGNMLKLANGQIGFMTIFAHPLFANVADLVPAMAFAGEEILTNKGVWFTRAEHEKQIKVITKRAVGDGGVSPRSQSPVGSPRSTQMPGSPLADKSRKVSTGSNLAHSELSDHTKDDLEQVKGLASPSERPKSSQVPLNGKKMSNGTEIHDPEAVTPRQEAADEGDQQLLDASHISGLDNPDRDKTETMRAGSQAIPSADDLGMATPLANGVNDPESAKEALAKFNFATSDVNEPVREVDPNHIETVPNAHERASAPTATLEHEAGKAMERAAFHDQATIQHADSDPASFHGMSTDHTRGHDGSDLTPTATSEGTSLYSGLDSPSLDESAPVNAVASANDAATAQNRPIPTPNHGQPNHPRLMQTFSHDSRQSGTTETTSRDTSKDGSRTAITRITTGNGSTTEEQERAQRRKDRKMSTKSVGYRRSKLKMSSLAFWKTKKENISDTDLSNTTTAAAPR